MQFPDTVCATRRERTVKVTRRYSAWSWRTILTAALIAVLAGIVVRAPTVHAAQPKVFMLSLVNNVLSSGDDTVRVRQGDEVQLKWSSDQPVELHLHGYDIEASVGPSAPAAMSFKASIAGRFPVEPHGKGTAQHHAVLYLEVRP
jgi:hypothetical protein